MARFTYDQIIKVRQQKDLLMPAIADDYHRIKGNQKLKICELTLKHLRDKKIIDSEQFSIYRSIAERPEDRTTITAKTIIEHVNRRFLEYYKSL